MKFTTVSIKEIQADKTHRLDAKYWIKKKQKEAGSCKPQASSATKKTQLKCINNLERRNYENIKTRMARQS